MLKDINFSNSKLTAFGHVEKIVRELVPTEHVQRCTERLVKLYEKEMKEKVNDWTSLKALVEMVQRDSEQSTQVFGKAFKSKPKSVFGNATYPVASNPFANSRLQPQSAEETKSLRPASTWLDEKALTRKSKPYQTPPKAVWNQPLKTESQHEEELDFYHDYQYAQISEEEEEKHHYQSQRKPVISRSSVVKMSETAETYLMPGPVPQKKKQDFLPRKYTKKPKGQSIQFAFWIHDEEDDYGDETFCQFGHSDASYRQQQA